MPALPESLRSQLEKAVTAARATAEEAAQVAIGAHDLAGGDGRQGRASLAEQVAFIHWHHMLLVRFLVENGLLSHPDGVPFSPAACVGDGWSLAARQASALLPGLFRLDDLGAQIHLAPEACAALERILATLPSALFAADDALGWAYQCWQAKAKREANEAVKGGGKVGAAELPPMTQLFTEDYMVHFLLENTLGAWWAARHPASPLVREFVFLRLYDDGSPVAGTFPGWPERAAEVTVLDPCCGAGHFLIAAFDMLRRMRMEEEGLDAAAAGDAVLRENLVGLEIDPRCTQIAALALALAAWKAGGYRTLPLSHLACSGIPVAGEVAEWRRLAEGDAALERTLVRLHAMFREAPILGSLIDPGAEARREGLATPDDDRVVPLVARALANEHGRRDPVAALFGQEGADVMVDLLARSDYTLVATNPPFLGQIKYCAVLRAFCQREYPAAKGDLATVFLQRMSRWCAEGGSYACVLPSNWLFQSRERALRVHLLTTQTWQLAASLGFGAFASGVNAQVMLGIFTNALPDAEATFHALSASEAPGPSDKARHLRTGTPLPLTLAAFLRGARATIDLSGRAGAEVATLGQYATILRGLSTGETNRFVRYFWELATLGEDWERLQEAAGPQPYSGRRSVILWQREHGEIAHLAERLRHLNHAIQSWRRGKPLWGRAGVAFNRMGHPHVTLYTGDRFSEDVGVVVTHDPAHVGALWAFFTSPDFARALKAVNPKLAVEPRYLDALPFDLAHWERLAKDAGPLPLPASNDPTQWPFPGDPVDSSVPLQVAMARLLGYRWPAQNDDQLGTCAVSGGIACLSAVAGEATVAQRLRALLAGAYGEAWSPAKEEALLAEVGYAGRTLEDWLRDAFFAQHCALFRNRPFLWHVWDRRKDGFAALVNYHTLDTATLDRLIDHYLGAWIARQRAERATGVAGADGRLIAALDLKRKLEAIREGEPPYDIYVRWKPLERQPLGWEPDLGDGVRLNIRPFITAGILRTRVAVHWRNDRGQNLDGSARANDLHLTRDEKAAARKIAAEMGA